MWDVSVSEAFHGSGPYSIFAGRDATLALAHMRIEQSDVNCMEGWKQLGQGGEASLDSWREYFDEKYPRVGVLREWHHDEPLEAAAGRLLQRNRARPPVTTLESGVQYEVLQPGEGATLSLPSGAAPMLEAHYRVLRADGVPFADSRRIEDGRPVALSVGDLEPGWVAGLAGMRAGEKRKIWVPAGGSEGQAEARGLLAASGGALIVEMELVGQMG